MKQQLLFTIFSLMIFAGTASSSDSIKVDADKPFSFMIKAGWGGGSYANTALSTGNYIIGINDKNQIVNFSIKLGSESNFDEAVRFLSFGFAPRIEPEAHIDVYALNYGLQYQTGVLYLSGSAGLGIMEGTVRGRFLRQSGSWFGVAYYQAINISTLCMPLKADLGLKFGIFLMSFTYEYIVSDIKHSGDLYFNIGLLF